MKSYLKITILAVGLILATTIRAQSTICDDTTSGLCTVLTTAIASGDSTSISTAQLAANAAGCTCAGSTSNTCALTLCPALSTAESTGVQAVIDIAQAAVNAGGCTCGAAEVAFSFSLMLGLIAAFKVFMN